MIEAYKFIDVQSGDWHYSFDEDYGGVYDALFWHRETVTLVEQPAQQQEPFAWLYKDSWGTIKLSNIMPPPVGAFPVYTSPPAKPWVSLTDEEVKHQWEIWRANVPRYVGFAIGIDAALKEKNT